MERIQTTADTPKIKIGIIQSADKVTFNCTNNFHILNHDNQKIFSGHADTDYEIYLENAQSARILYQIRVAFLRK